MKLLKALSTPNTKLTIAAANSTGNNLPTLLLIYINKWGGGEKSPRLILKQRRTMSLQLHHLLQGKNTLDNRFPYVSLRQVMLQRI